MEIDKEIVKSSTIMLLLKKTSIVVTRNAAKHVKLLMSESHSKVSILLEVSLYEYLQTVYSVLPST